MSILVVDDNAVIRKAISLVFEHAGLKVDEAEDGNQGLQLFMRGSYDVVVSDIDMPDMDGVEMARRIKQYSPDIEIYAFTGSSGTMLLDEVATCFTRIFSKPGEMKLLAAAVKDYCATLSMR